MVGVVPALCDKNTPRQPSAYGRAGVLLGVSWKNSFNSAAICDAFRPSSRLARLSSDRDLCVFPCIKLSIYISMIIPLQLPPQNRIGIGAVLSHKA